MRYRFGKIALVDFLFADRNAEKRRPGLILAQGTYSDLLVARISSKRAELTTDVTLVDWKNEGLNISSTVRLLKMTTINESCVLRSPGEISNGDKEAIIWALKEFTVSLEEAVV